MFQWECLKIQEFLFKQIEGSPELQVLRRLTVQMLAGKGKDTAHPAVEQRAGLGLAPHFPDL